MKKILLLLVGISWLACTNETTGHAHGGTNPDTATNASGAHHNTLKKEGKWNADEATNKNVAQLQNKAAALNKTNANTVAGYQRISDSLQTSLNQLVRECKMKGRDHDALHLWLEPLLSEVKSLKTVADANAGERLFHSIRTRLADYNLYFE